MTAQKRKTLTRRVAELEAEVWALRKAVPACIVRELQAFLDGERARITDEVIYGRLKQEMERMGEGLYDRLTHHRVSVTIHTDDGAPA